MNEEIPRSVRIKRREAEWFDHIFPDLAAAFDERKILCENSAQNSVNQRRRGLVRVLSIHDNVTFVDFFNKE